MGQTTSQKATTSSTRATCYDTASQTHWVFWSTGSNITYASSSDTEVWTNKGSLPYSSLSISVTCRVLDGSSLVFLTALNNSGEVVLLRGTIANAQLSFEPGVTAFEVSSAEQRYRDPHIALDNNGRIWVSAFLDLGPIGDRFLFVARRSKRTGSQSIDFESTHRIGKPSASVTGINLATLQGDAMLAVVSGEGGTGIMAYQFNGVSWELAGNGGDYRASSFAQGGLNQSVRAVAIYNGSLYVGGTFTRAGGVPANYIARWDGESWSDVAGGVNGAVYALTVLGSELYVAGNFTSANGVIANYIAKWDGSTWRNLGPGFNSTVSELLVAEGTLYAAGNFTNSGSTVVNRIARWSGSTWLPLGNGTNATISALCSINGLIYAGGMFTAAGDTLASYIAAWNGNNWSPLSSGVNGPVTDIAGMETDLYVAGSFSSAGGVAANYLARWSGNNWSAVGSSPSNRFNNSIYSLAAHNGDLYVAGDFTSIGFNPVYKVARWDGTSWSSLGVGIGGNSAYTLTVADSRLYVGGSFTSAGGINTANLASWELQDSIWSGFGSGVNGIIYSMALSGTDLYVGGSFTSIGGVAANYIARWDGSNWSALANGVNAPVRTLKLVGPDLYVGGLFTTAGGIAAPYIAKWTGSQWSNVGGGTLGQVLAIESMNGAVYVGGSFQTAGNVAANMIAKWDGSNWSALGPGFNQTVSSLAVSGNTLYAGGLFWNSGGVSMNHIAAWDGSSWSSLGSGANEEVWVIKTIGSDIYIGGGFTSVGGKPINRIAAWDGKAWRGLGTGTNNWVYGIDTLGSDIIAAGAFTSAGGQPARYIARWDGSQWRAVGDGAPSSVWSVAAAGEDIFTGGQSPALFQRGVANDQLKGTRASLVSGASGTAHVTYINNQMDLKLRSFRGAPLTWSTVTNTYTGSATSVATSFEPISAKLISWFTDSGAVWRHEASSPYNIWSNPRSFSNQGNPISIDADRSANWRGHALAIWNRANSTDRDVMASLGLDGPLGLPTDTPTATPTPTATDTFTPTFTFTPTLTFTPTDTYTPTSTFTPTFTDTPTATFTNTPENTPTPTPTMTSVPTQTSTPLPPATPTNTPIPIFPSYGGGNLTISGEVVDQSGQAVANVLVYSADLGVMATDTQGRFNLRGARAGFDYELLVRRDGVIPPSEQQFTRPDRYARIVVTLRTKPPAQCQSRDVSNLIIRAGSLATRLYTMAIADYQTFAEKRQISIPTKNMTRTHLLYRRYLFSSAALPDVIVTCPQSIKASGICSTSRNRTGKLSLINSGQSLRREALLGNRILRDVNNRPSAPSIRRVKLIRTISDELARLVAVFPETSDVCLRVS